MKPCNINIFLWEGDPNGIRDAQISMSTIQAIAFRRNQLGKAWKTFSEITRPGVYILLGQDEENVDKWLAYIGESESVGDRLNVHNAQKKGPNVRGFWAETIVLVSKDENLTKSHARYVEARLIAMAGRNPRWSLANSQRAEEKGKLPLPDRAAMDEFVDQTIILAGVLGCDLFRTMRGSLPGETKEEAPTSLPPVEGPVFSYKGRGFAAEMILSASGEFIVKRGSKVRLEETKTIQRGIVSLRNLLIEKVILSKYNRELVFSSDYTFSSVSTAAAVAYGGSVNGRRAWRLPDGRTYANWEAGEIADTKV